ncbi:MAG: OmpH family outer membrane protein [Desulfuromonadales bacterium]|jgi:outer membrane protein
MKRIVGLVLAALILSSVPALASDMKLGYVDLQKALNESNAGKAAKEKIAAKVKEYQKKVEAKQDELKKLKEDLDKQAMLLSQDARSAKEHDYQQKLKDFQRYTKDIQDDLQQKDADYTKSIIQDLVKVVQKIGKKEGYTLILEKGEGSIIYADDKVNMTDEVIQAYNAQSQNSAEQQKGAGK